MLDTITDDSVVPQSLLVMVNQAASLLVLVHTNAPAVPASYRSDGQPVPKDRTVSNVDGVVPHVSAVRLPPDT